VVVREVRTGELTADEVAAIRQLLWAAFPPDHDDGGISEDTKTAIEGSATFDASAFPGIATWPLKPGTYEIRFLVDDSYRSIAVSANFKVVKP
jgi:hypothetical protein